MRIKDGAWVVWDHKSGIPLPKNIIENKYNYVYKELYIINEKGKRFYDLSGFISFYDFIEREFDLNLGNVVLSNDTVSTITDFNRRSDGIYQALLNDLIWVEIDYTLVPLNKHRNVIIDDILDG